MYIYRHHTASDVIDLDPETGRWTPVADADRPPVGALAVTYRDAYPIRGSYTEEGGKRYCMYWTSDSRFEFLPANQAPISIGQRCADGSTKMDDLGMRCTIEPAKYNDGRLRQGFSRFTLVSGAGHALFEIAYNSDVYLQMAGADFTSASGFEDIGEWDFFVALKNAIETLTDEASTGRTELRLSGDDTALIHGTRVSRDALLYAESGSRCTRNGIWAVTDDLRHFAQFTEGETLPRHQERAVQWVWCRER